MATQDTTRFIEHAKALVAEALTTATSHDSAQVSNRRARLAEAQTALNVALVLEAMARAEEEEVAK